MKTPAARALKILSPRVKDAPIHNYLAREGRLNTYAEKISKRGIVTVRDFVLAAVTSRLDDIRLSPRNRQRVEGLLTLFGVEDTPKRPCSGKQQRAQENDREP
jgi:hypothetical protein